MLIGENGIISQSQQAKLENKITQAREKIELTFEHAQILKNTEQRYNQNDYLDDLMKSEIPNIKIKGDIIIVDDFAFEIDRSVPQIGQYLGKENDLIFPEITTTVYLATDSKTATIQIKAKEETNGISKIEVIKGNNVLKQYNYENKKELITENYITKYNGTYKIKVYSNLTVSEKVEIEGLISSVSYSPSGNNEYKKEHQVKVYIEGEADGIKSLKYQWLQTSEEPEPETFINLCNNNEIITGNNFNGTYYLWTLLETQSGNINICRSEEFNFDNQGPIVTLSSIPVSESSFMLNATADDEYSEISKYEFYVEDILKETIKIQENTSSYTVSDLSMGTYNCFVIVTDKLGNKTKATTIEKSRTKQYTWEKWTSKREYIYSNSRQTQIVEYTQRKFPSHTYYRDYKFSTTEGFVGVGDTGSTYDYPVGTYNCYVTPTKVERICLIRNKNNELYDYSIETYECSREEIYTKGDYKYDSVYANNSDSYPYDGYSNNRILVCFYRNFMIKMIYIDSKVKDYF